MIISLDTEGTGIDIYHGARPFFVTVCYKNGSQRWWEWDVDPLTRIPEIDSDDLEEIQVLCEEAERIIMHNGKYDVTSLTSVNQFSDDTQAPLRSWERFWPKCEDTIIAGHVLASNQPHNLKTMYLMTLGVDNLKPLEDKLQVACTEARRIAKKYFPSWRIAREDDPSMPSVTSGSKRDEDRPWKNDCWLPRELAKRLKLGEDHPWWTVLRDYSNGDSAATMLLWLEQERLLKERGYWDIYRSAYVRGLPDIIHRMERYGVTLSMSRLDSLQEEHMQASQSAQEACENIAVEMGYNLCLPKGGRSTKLTDFCFNVLKLPVGVITETGQPALNKEAFAYWKDVLNKDSVQAEFIDTFQYKKTRDIAVGYMMNYRRYAQILNGNPGGAHCLAPGGARYTVPEQLVLHPSSNQTGTATTRFASYNPNSQNFSKKAIEIEEQEEAAEEGKKIARSLRWCFGPAEGREWWRFDGENLELRLPAYYCKEQEMIELFERPNDPPYYGKQHLMNFHTVYPDLWAEVEKEVGWEHAGPECQKRFKATWYQWCKNGDFAIQYQAGDETADRAFHRIGARRLLKSRFNKLEKLNVDTVRFAEKHGYIETIPDLTVDPKHGYPLFCSRTDRGGIMPTVPLSYMIQGSAGIWIRKAMVRVDNQHREWNHKPKDGFDGHLILQIHDELDLDWPKGGDPAEDRACEIATKTNAADWIPAKNIRQRIRPDRNPTTSNLWRARVMQRLIAQGGDDFGMPGKTPVGVDYHPHNWAEGVEM
jgi:hypothetical protein